MMKQPVPKHTKWTKDDSYEIDWSKVNALPKCVLELNSQMKEANLPVNGTLQVSLKPSSLENLPRTLMVYKLVPLVTSAEQFKGIAAKFGIRGPMTEGYIQVRQGSRSITYDPENGELSYIDYDLERKQYDKPEVPSKEECAAIALRIAKSRGLLPEGSRVIATNVTSGTIGLSRNHSWEGVVNRTIVIGCDLVGGNYPTRGSGMQLRMTIGNKGELIDLTDNLRALTPYGEFPSKPIEQALSEAQAGKDTLNLESAVENPTVSDVAIFYYADASDREHGLLLPVYAFMSGNCCIYVPAVIPK